MRDQLSSTLIFTASFISFPAGGIAGGLVSDQVDSTLTALLGGLVTGAVIGTGQSLLSRGRLDPRRWIPATAIGMALGLAAGVTAVGFGTSLGDLAVAGAITGALIGPAQAIALRGKALRGRGFGARLAWAAAMPLLWALGWTVTTAAGVQVEEQFTVFGSTGAITVSALLSILLGLLAPSPAVSPARIPTPIGEL